jgi:hypothetical protein
MQQMGVAIFTHLLSVYLTYQYKLFLFEPLYSCDPFVIAFFYTELNLQL